MVTVLYIAGKGRSGSTLLDRTLGQVSGVLGVGELWRLWREGLLGGARCGCGEPVAVCPFWREVTAHPAVADHSPDEVIALQRQLLRWPAVPRLLRQPRDKLQRWPALRAYAQVLAGLYRALAQVSGADVIVDSSKFPADPGPLGLLPGMEVVTVHLVRDPRAVAYSYQRRKLLEDHAEQPTAMPTFGPVSATASWLVRNAAMELVRRRHPADRWMRLRYESFVAHPRRTIDQLLAMAGHPRSTSEVFPDAHSVRLGPTHTVGGNPAKFRQGRVPLRLDDEWQQRLSPADRTVATLMSLPLLRRYGYPVRLTRRQSPSPA